MLKHETKSCPKCSTILECKVGDILNCECNIDLHQATKEFLTKTSFDCLCADCLKQINELGLLSQKHQFPIQKEFFIEGLHYYTENNYWVFTELYHLLRGYCCKNGCRHCVYGYKKSKTK